MSYPQARLSIIKKLVLKIASTGWQLINQWLMIDFSKTEKSISHSSEWVCETTPNFWLRREKQEKRRQRKIKRGKESRRFSIFQLGWFRLNEQSQNVNGEWSFACLLKQPQRVSLLQRVHAWKRLFVFVNSYRPTDQWTDWRINQRTDGQSGK